jgi:hypothetical protein
MVTRCKYEFVIHTYSTVVMTKENPVYSMGCKQGELSNLAVRSDGSNVRPDVGTWDASRSSNYMLQYACQDDQANFIAFHEKNSPILSVSIQSRPCLEQLSRWISKSAAGLQARTIRLLGSPGWARRGLYHLRRQSHRL